MGYLETYDLANAQSFRARLVTGIVMQAGMVLQQDMKDLSPAHRGKRIQLANTVLNDPENVARSFVWPVLSNVSIAAAGLESTDGDIQYQIAQVWDVIAGVTDDEKIVAGGTDE